MGVDGVDGANGGAKGASGDEGAGGAKGEKGGREEELRVEYSILDYSGGGTEYGRVV